MSWLSEPLYSIDTEATGLDTSTDRIITCCAGLSTGIGDWRPTQWLINPGVEIPQAAIDIHGLTNEIAAQGSDPREALSGIADLLDGASDARWPVVIFNAPFDLSLLSAEFKRHLDRDLPPLLVIDVLVIAWRFHKSTGSRRLEALAERHGITFPAHDATADALASLRLLHIIAGHDELLPHLSLTGLQELQREWHDQRQDQIRARAEGAGYPITDEPSDWPLRAA